MEPIIKVIDIAYARFTAPDLDRMETFLTDFGLHRAARTDTALYMRAHGTDHHVHITELGEPEFVGLGFHAGSAEDLDTLSRETGHPVLEIGEPGGGKMVRLKDPDGYVIDVVHGIETVEPLPVCNEIVTNFGSEHPRKGDVVRLEPGPAPCLRLGHAVIHSSDFRASDAFYKRHLGFLNSDVCYDGDDEDNVMLAFNRCDRGEEFVDHHTLLTAPVPEKGLGHIAFEVQDINAIHVGAAHLEAKGYKHSWGVGRHILGAQIFDYWFDPFGFRVEHWTDGDLLNNASETGVHPYSNRFATQWGVTEDERL